MKLLHERMPVILKPDIFSEWLDLNTKEKELLLLLKPLEDGELEIRECNDPSKEPMVSLFT
jgi:putative SOS response-associated peptidase YedK